MRKINIYLVESPFQLLSAIEAKEYFKSFDSLLIIKNVLDNKSNELMEKLISFTTWDKIIKINYTIATIVDFHFLYNICKLKKKKQKIEYIFVGFPRTRGFQWFCEKLNSRKCFILDDGTHTIELQKNFFLYGNYLQGKDRLDKKIDKNLVRHSKNLLKIFIIKYFFGLKNTRNIKYNLFTCYNLEVIPGQQIVQHSFEYIKSKISSFTFYKDTVYFYGTPLSETGILQLNVEINLLKKIIYFYKKKKKRLLYIPHRIDSIMKVRLIEKEGIEVKKFSFIAEIEPIMSQTLSSEIASFFSTVLYTLPKIYPYDNVTSFMLQEDMIIRDDRKKAIKEIYKEYEKYMNVILLNFDSAKSGTK